MKIMVFTLESKESANYSVRSVSLLFQQVLNRSSTMQIMRRCVEQLNF